MQPLRAWARGIATKPHQATPQPREAHSRFPYRKHVESLLSKRLAAIFKTECFN